MKSEERSQVFLRKRKMVMVLPLMVIPFLTMAFYALGGGQGKQNPATAQTAGLNLNLPSSNLKNDDPDNKLSFYDKAEKDSIKMEEWMRTDPYYKGQEDTALNPPTSELENLTATTASRFQQQLNPSPYEEQNSNPEQQLLQKLSLLKKELNKPSISESKKDKQTKSVNEYGDLYNQMDRLEGMM